MDIYRCRRVFAGLALGAMVFAAQAFADGPGKDKKDKKVRFDNLVVVGDSLSAGFQNFSLFDNGPLGPGGQPHGYAALFAQQANVANFTLPLISWPGFPPELALIPNANIEGFPVIAPASNTPGSRENPCAQPTDLAVPGVTISQILNKTPNPATFSVPPTPIDILTLYVLGHPGCTTQAFPPLSQVDQAVALKPSFVILWGGNNDALGALMAGTDAALTPVSDFEQSFSQIISRLAAHDTPIAVGLIPDVTSVPYLVPIAALPPNITATEPGAVYVTLDGLSAALTAIAGGSPAYALNPNQTLTATEIGNIQSAVNQYNQIIRRYAWRNDATVVDTNLLLKILSVFGYYVNGKHLTTQFLGGLFSLDGVHPTNTGYAIMANTFIEVINLSYGKRIPLVDVSQVAATDPLVQQVASSPLPKPGVLRKDVQELFKAFHQHQP